MQEETTQNVFEDTVIEGVDIRKGQTNFSTPVYMEVLRAWCKYIPASLERLSVLAEAVANGGECGEYTIAVHGFKGSGNGIFAYEIGKEAEALENAGRNGDVEFINANNKPFMEKTALLHTRLEEFLAAHATPDGKKTLAGAPDPDLLARFLDACKHYRSNEMEDILKKLEVCEYESNGELVPWLREQTDDLEYDAIQKRLTEELGTRHNRDGKPAR